MMNCKKCGAPQMSLNAFGVCDACSAPISVTTTPTQPSITLDGVTEYGEGDAVKLELHGGRVVVVATNEGGYCSTAVDLQQLVDWLASPENKQRLVWLLQQRT
jgi:hypothetical protein